MPAKRYRVDLTDQELSEPALNACVWTFRTIESTLRIQLRPLVIGVKDQR
jgi:hypothetical protein